MPTARLRLAPEPRSVGVARRMLREALTRWGADGLEFAASQALTELATNAVIHARTEFEVTMQWADEVLRVGVADWSRKIPVRRTHAVDATTGRGLALVDRLCPSWGVESTVDGKEIWFEVTARSDADWLDVDFDVVVDDDDQVAAVATSSDGLRPTTPAPGATIRFARAA